MTLLTGSANCIKYVLFAFNFVLVITGIILISVGVTTEAVFYNYKEFLTSNFFSIPTLLIVTGAFIFLIAFFGCCGAIREHYCMLFSFSVLLGVIFILELAGGISGYVLRNEAYDAVKGQLEHSMMDYGNVKEHLPVTELWDQVQQKFQCCGLDNSTDWINARGALPMSCCKPPVGVFNSTTCEAVHDNLELYDVGCLSFVADYIKVHAVSLGAAGICIAILQFIGIFFACYIAREVKIKYGGTGPF